MKLTKLLPLATIASVATILTPLVTSCGSGGYTLDLTKVEDYKLVDQMEGEMTTEEATQKYFDAIFENNKIYADDIFYKTIKGGSVAPEGTNATITIKNITVDKEKFTISATFISNANGEAEVLGANMKIDEVLTYEIKNVPFKVKFSGSHWLVSLTYQEETDWTNDDNWSVFRSGHYYVWKNNEKTDDLNFDPETYNSKTQDVMTKITLILPHFTPGESYYLGKITKKD